VRDLSSELFSAKAEVVVRVAVRVVEQERGLELQVNFPEFTLATMLPIVSVIEAASALKIEVFSAKLETELSEPLSNLNIEVILAKAETEVTDPLRLLAESHPGVMKSIAVLIVVSVIVVAAVVPEYCHTTQTSNAKKLPLVQVICD